MKNTILKLTAIGVVCSLFSCEPTRTTSETPMTEVLTAEVVQGLFTNNCASCHMDNGTSQAPALFQLSMLSPKSVVATLETGKMQVQGAVLSKAEKIAIAEMLTNKKYTEEKPPLNYCQEKVPWESQVKYSGWGGDPESTGFIPAEHAGIDRESVPSLKLKWAFGFDGGGNTRTKPTIIGNHMIFGSEFGEVYCLNKDTGCVKWMFEADANIRGGITVNQDNNGDVILHFADFSTNAYAVKAETGELLWKVLVRDNANNAVSGTPAYHDGMLYVPLTSMEVVSAGNENFECCKSSGQVVALNSATGQVAWRHRVVSEEAVENGVNRVGTKRFGPSGAPVWSSPTVDEKRGVLYVGTGENYSNPPTLTSDAIQALDLKSGEIRWTFQATPKDAYISACTEGGANCPDPSGPDVDFGMAPILTTRPDGREVLVVGQKSGVVHSLDPDTGKPIWQERIGRGGALGGIHWGMATDGKLVYAANSDWFEYGGEPGVDPNPGLFALDIMTGKVVWKNTPDPALCEGKTGCYNSHSAAPTLIPGVVFAGALDGHARAYDAATGEILWDFDTNREYETVNGVEARGGSIDGPAPVVSDGMVYFNSGYALFGEMPGNVLLAFEIE